MDSQNLGAIDPSALETLLELDDSGAIRDQVVAAVLLDLEKLPPEIRAAADAEEHERLRKLAHSLKSCVGNVGAVGLSALLREIELAARAGDGEWIDAGVESLESTVPVVRAALDATSGPRGTDS